MTTKKKKTAYYSLTFKREVLKRILSKELTAHQALGEYGIGGSMTVYRWLDQREKILGMALNQGKMEDEQSQPTKAELVAELAMVRRLLEQERLRSEAYLTMIKLAEEKYQLPIEKKTGGKRSNK